MNLTQRAEEIRKLGKQTIQNIVQIGRHLIEAKKEVGHGNWGNWLEKEFDWSVTTASRLVGIAEMFPFKFSGTENLKLVDLKKVIEGTTSEQRKKAGKSLAGKKKPINIRNIKKELERNAKKRFAKLKPKPMPKGKIYKVTKTQMALRGLKDVFEEELPKLTDFTGVDNERINELIVYANKLLKILSEVPKKRFTVVEGKSS